MNYRRSRQSKRSNRNRSNRNRSRRNRRGGALEMTTLIRAYNNWAARNGSPDQYPLAIDFSLEGRHIVLTERRKEEDGVKNRMVARYNTESKRLEIISGDPTQKDLVANLDRTEIDALAKNE